MRKSKGDVIGDRTLLGAPQKLTPGSKPELTWVTAEVRVGSGPTSDSSLMLMVLRLPRDLQGMQAGIRGTSLAASPPTELVYGHGGIKSLIALSCLVTNTSFRTPHTTERKQACIQCKRMPRSHCSVVNFSLHNSPVRSQPTSHCPTWSWR